MPSTLRRARAEVEARRAARIGLLTPGERTLRHDAVPALARLLLRAVAVLALVGVHFGSGRGRRLGDALDDHDVVAALEVNDDLRIAGERASLPRFATAAEEEAAVLPKAPYGRRVRPDGRDPVIPRTDEAFLGPRPRQHPLRLFGHAVAGEARPAGNGLAHSAITTGTGAGEGTASGLRASRAN